MTLFSDLMFITLDIDNTEMIFPERHLIKSRNCHIYTYLNLYVVVCVEIMSSVNSPNVMTIVSARLGCSSVDILGSYRGQPPKTVTSVRPGASSMATVECLNLGSTPSGTGSCSG